MVKNFKLYFFLSYDILNEIMINTVVYPVSLVASGESGTLKDKC